MFVLRGRDEIMGNLRKDYVLEKFVIFPDQNKNDEAHKNESECPFCPGNELMTERATLALVAKDGILKRLSDTEENLIEEWSVRVFQSSNPSVTTSGAVDYTDRPHYSEPAYGYHQTVVASPDHNQNLASISIEQWTNVLLVIQDRVRWLYTQKGVTYVAIYVNDGEAAGTNVRHPHLNLLTLSTIPPAIGVEADAAHRFMNENGNCPACLMLNAELDGPRQILSTDTYLAFCPWASSYPYEYWIYPKKHMTTFSKISQKEINGLALILRATLGGLAKALSNISFNLVFHLSPEKKNSRQIHWHIEIYPHLANWSGLERGFGIFVNSIGPEKSAEVLGAASRKELAGLVGIT